MDDIVDKTKKNNTKKKNKKESRDFKSGIQLNIFSVVLIDIILLECISALFNYKTSMSALGVNIVIIFSAVIISIVSSFISGRNLANKIAIPINFCAERLKRLSEGDLANDVSFVLKEDEIGKLIISLNTTISGLNNIINDISYHLGAIEKGDYTTEVTLNYAGDFSAIETSIRGIIKALNKMMSQIDESAEQVASGSVQVAAGSQALSQGATEQASSIEELAATLNEITEQINNNAKNAENAKNATLHAANEVENGSKQIKDMIAAMDEINESSAEIGKIIKAIEDIAFQTNILALNAAVEAARAGSAGKGFAVVADEVRNLASKSAEAAKNTTELIENSMKAIEKGTKIAEKTDISLKLIVDKTNLSLNLVEEIASASEQQAIGASQVTVGIDQISSVVQTNSATAEESAASSEELSSQAQMLKDIIKSIKLKDNI